MYCCWIFLDHDPGSTQRRVGALRILNSAALVCSRYSVENIRFMRGKNSAFGTASWTGTDPPPQVGSSKTTFGCRIEPIKKSANYEVSGALQRRAGALR